MSGKVGEVCQTPLGKVSVIKTKAFECCFSDGDEHFYNQALPLHQVRTAEDSGGNVGYWMEKAFRSMFMFLQRSNDIPTKYLEPRVTNCYRG